MKRQLLSVALALCVCISSQSAAYAYQEVPSQQENVFTQESPTGSVFGSESSAGTDQGQQGASTEQGNISKEEPSEDSGPGLESDAGTDQGQQGAFTGQENVSEEEPPEASESGLESDDEMDHEQQEVSMEQETISEEEPPEDSESGLESSDEEEGLSEELLLQEEASVKKSANRLAAYNSRSTIPTPSEVYASMIALKDQEGYREGTTWTDDEPYSDSKGYYYWKGGMLDEKNISAVGCVAFAFILSDAAFGSLPARMYAQGGFTFEDIKTGDILRLNTDTHTVIVLEVSDVGVVVAEGNISSGDHKGKVHWGRAIPKETVMNDASHYITRYPEGYVAPDDPDADTSVAGGTFGGGFSWDLTKAGTLTVSGVGAMPDFGSADGQPWSGNSSEIKKVVIADGVTSIGSCAFWNCGLLSVEIPSSVTSIGGSAFRGSKVISVTIPSGVETIGDDAFRECRDLSSVVVSEGVRKISQNVFRACTSLQSIALPASIEEVGSAAFFECTAMKVARFAPGNRQVKLGDDMFARCYWLMEVTLPLQTDRISERMFQNCGMLPGVEIPQGAESIGGSAFASSGASVVIIPDSVTTIGSAAFSACPLADIYFTGTEEQWDRISKIGDTASAVSQANIHYNYTPGGNPGDNPGGSSGGNQGDNPSSGSSGNPGDNSGDHSGSNLGSGFGDYSGNGLGDIPGDDSGWDKAENNTENTPDGNPNGSSGNRMGYDSRQGSAMASSIVNSGIKAVVEAWKPATPDERKRYACMGKETVRYTMSNNNAYQIDIENTMQGPLCFQSFEAVLGEYTIGRTYNIYPHSDTVYSMDKEIQFTIKIPPAIYKKGREYKMICVTKGGQPFLYNDVDSDPETITIKTNKFYAYALIYK